MPKQLRIHLPNGWIDFSDVEPFGPLTYIRDTSRAPGSLQISLAEHKEGPAPRPSAEELEKMSINLGRQQAFDRLLKSWCGRCEFGLFGTSVFAGRQHAHAQIWYLSNGYDFVLATHLCPEDFAPEEVREAEEIVLGLRLENFATQTILLGENGPATARS